MTTTGSEGDTCRRRPRCAPAGATWMSSVRLAGTIPRRRMSSVKEVIVSSWAIFGSLTNVPLPCRRTSMPFADELVERGADGEARDAQLGRQLPLGGNRIAHPELLDQVEHRGS